VEPALGQCQLHFPLVEPQCIPIAARRLIDAGDNRAILAARQHPGGQREPVVEAKASYVPSVEMTFAVEIERLAEPARGEHRLAVADLALVQRSVEGEV